MTKKHLIEFWPYLAGKNPADIRLEQKNELITFEREQEFKDMVSIPVDGLTKRMHEKIIADVEDAWQQALDAGKPVKNNMKPNIAGLSADGSVIYANYSTYKTSFGMKTRLSEYPFHVQKIVANQFAPLNVGTVAMTSDDCLLAEQRDPNASTAGGMILPIPCGYADTSRNKTLADVVNFQSTGELQLKKDTGLEKFIPYIENGSLNKYVRDIKTLGLQRESAEWTPNFLF